MHKAATGRVENKKLLSHRRQSNYSLADVVVDDFIFYTFISDTIS